MKKQIPVGTRRSAGIAYIYLPSDVDRNKYIENCFRVGKVTILTQDNQVIHNVPIGKLCIQFIEFPKNSKELGSVVLWVNIPKHNKPIITDVYYLEDEYSDVTEKQFKFKRNSDTSHSEISGKGKKGQLFLEVFSTEEDGAEFLINVINNKNKGKFNINVKGSTNIDTEGITNIKTTQGLYFEITDLEKDNKKSIIEYTKSKGFTYEDEFSNKINIKDGEVSFTTKKFKLNKGDEAMVLGNILKTLLDDFITAVSSITVTTMLGTQPIINKVQVELLKKEVPKILSELGYLSKK